MRLEQLTTRPFPLQETDDPFRSTEWPASWIGPTHVPASSFVVAYRLRFRLDTDTSAEIHVSADQRYELYCDGERIGRGPERGDVMHWFYESYALSLAAGEHVLIARCWTLDIEHYRAPAAQISVQPAFLLAAAEPHTELLSTGKATWETQLVDGYTFEPTPFKRGGELAGGTVRIDGVRYPWGIEHGEGDAWTPAPHLRPARDGIDGWGECTYWRLRPATLPAMIERPVRPGRIRHVDASADDDLVRAAENRSGDEASWQALWSRQEPVRVPPHTHRRVLIDLDNYYAGYFDVTTAGGAGSAVAVRWAESLYVADGQRHAKGDRNAIDGKHFIGRGDTFAPDGGADRRFTGLWWNCGRYIQLRVRTADEPLTLQSIGFRETRYPLDMQSSVELPDNRFAKAVPVMWRTLQMCAHETYMDCPYYEQLMYLGDTRVQALVTYVSTRDDRLPRKAITMFEASRTYNGLLQSRYPCSRRQIIPQFSLFWIGMLHDFALWRGDRTFLSERLPTMRGVLEVFLGHIGDDGLLRTPEGWNWVDWVPGWSAGHPPLDGTGISGINNWQLAMILTRAAELESWIGDADMGRRYRAVAQRLAEVMTSRMFDTQRGLFADTPSKDQFSEHAQCYALLSHLLDGPRAKRVAQGLLADPYLSRGTIYFRHYLFEVFREMRRPDAIVDRMTLWYDLVERGLRTAVESPEPTRSDCHAWSAHPLYHAYASLIGIRPASFGFERVWIEPQLGGMPEARATMVHPRGTIDVALQCADGGLRGDVALPEGVSGVLAYAGREVPLRGGSQSVVVSPEEAG